MSLITPTTVLETFGPGTIPNINRSKKSKVFKHCLDYAISNTGLGEKVASVSFSCLPRGFWATI